MQDFWREECVNLGAVFDLGGDCYGCRHPERFHRPKSLYSGDCECCVREAARRVAFPSAPDSGSSRTRR